MVDEVILELPKQQQMLIIEHFFRGRSQRDLAAEMKLSQPTILRRIDAAVDELRKRLSERGHDAAAPALAGALAKFTGPSVPSTITAQLTKIGLAGVSTAAAGSTGVVVTIGATIVLLGTLIGGAVLLLQQGPPPVATTGSPATPQVVPPSTNPSDWRAAFERAYALEPAQNLKFIPPPPLPERQRYFHEVEKNDQPMPFIQWRWINGNMKRELMQASGPDGASLLSVLGACTKLDSHHVSIADIAPIDADGDWIVRDGAPTQAILADLQKILHDHFNLDVRFEKEEVQKQVFVVSGSYRFQRLADATSRELQVFSDVMDHPKPGDSIMGGGTTSPSDFWTMMGGYLGMPFVDESQNEPARLNWLLSRSLMSGNTAAGRQQVLDNLSKQTGLVFKNENRILTTWKVVRETTGPATAK